MDRLNWTRRPDPPLTGNWQGDHLEVLQGPGGQLLRKDPGGHITLLHERKRGLKLRISNDTHLPHAFTPELIDLKITDGCRFGCPACYMGSTPQGQHAPWIDLQEIARILAHSGTLEVAIGGGEPTEHPDLFKLLDEFRRWRVIPCFTTRDPGFVNTHWDRIFPTAGGVAISVDGGRGTRAALGQLVGRPIQECINLHIVIGLGSQQEFRDALEQAQDSGIRVTLLGYKYTGRASPKQEQAHEWWIDEMMQSQADISIDTVLASRWENKLREIGIPSHLYHTTDGVWSAYVDATRWSVHPSSYETSIAWKLQQGWTASFRQEALHRSTQSQTRPEHQSP